MKLQSLLLAVMIACSTTAQALSEAEYDRDYTDLLMPGYIEEFTKVINYAQLTDDVSYKLSTAEVDDRCVALMDGKLLAGEIGKTLSKIYLDHRNQLKSLDDGGTLKTKYCSRYSKMSAKEKSIVWVFILTAVAHFESNCTRTASAKGTNGTAYGFYQLHQGQEHNYDGKNGICEKGDAAKPVAASRCALSMLDKQLQNRKGELFSNKSYWDVLRPAGRANKAALIKRALMRSSLCNPVSF